MSTATATVEVLTAQVRVLMVGSRQITASVAKQLDSAPLASVTVFGRIRLTGLGDLVIGANAAGELVTAYYGQGPDAKLPIIDLPDEATRFSVCESQRVSSRDDTVRVHFGERSILLFTDAVNFCTGKGHYWRSAAHCNGWEPNGNEDLIREQIAQYDEYQRPYIAAAAAPLIVLAGLR